METCTKCSGKGQISSYSHVNNGICFDCSGSGTKGVKDNNILNKNIEKKSLRIYLDRLSHSFIKHHLIKNRVDMMFWNKYSCDIIEENLHLFNEEVVLGIRIDKLKTSEYKNCNELIPEIYFSSNYSPISISFKVVGDVLQVLIIRKQTK